jgi:ribbon-helix-helix CopG family protein
VDPATKRIENLQTLVTQQDRRRVEQLAQRENRSVSDMIRVLLLESLTVWEKSANGRKRR